MFEFKIADKDKGRRLDLFLAGKISSNTRSQIKKMIAAGFVLINSAPAKSAYRLKHKDLISVKIPPPQKLEAEPEDIPLKIIYEDQDLLVINKPAGLVTHPAPGNWRGTLVNAILHHCQNISGGSDKLRPGIVHRLDKETSGILVVAKTAKAHQSLAQQFLDRTIKKVYLAVVQGRLCQNKGIISVSIGRNLRDRKKMAAGVKGREALTEFKVLKRFNDYTLVELYPKTGRTHQLRVHLHYLGHPIAGDDKYKFPSAPLRAGKSKKEKFKTGLMLHAQRLGFTHPATGKYVEFEAPPPPNFISLMREFDFRKRVG